MQSYAIKTQENKTNSTANTTSKTRSNRYSTFQFRDNRLDASVQRKLQETADIHIEKQPIQKQTNKQTNNTGLPNNLKSGIENLSGYSMDDVKVHYNSNKPTQLQAHAYAQGTDIHIASGQERHLPHEAWHVVQQKQGRVRPTAQMKGKININDDTGLEKEADVMGERALQFSNKTNIAKSANLNYSSTTSSYSNSTNLDIIQGQWWVRLEQLAVRSTRMVRGKVEQLGMKSAMHSKKYLEQAELFPETEKYFSKHILGPLEISTLFKSLGGQESKFESTLLKLKVGKSFQYAPMSVASHAARLFSKDMNLNKKEETQLNIYFSSEILGAEKSAHPLEEDSLFNLDFFPKLYLFKLIAGGKKKRFVPSMWGDGVGSDSIESMNEVEWEMGIDLNNLSLASFLAGDTISMIPLIAGHNIRRNPRLGSKFGYSRKSTGDGGEIMGMSNWSMFFGNVYAQKFDAPTKFELDQIPIIFNDILRLGTQKRYESSVEYGITSSQETDVLEVYQILEAHDSMLAQKALPKLILDSRNMKFPKQQQKTELPAHMIEKYRGGHDDSRLELFMLLAKHGISWPQLLSMIGVLLMFKKYMSKKKGEDSAENTDRHTIKELD